MTSVAENAGCLLETDAPGTAEKWLLGSGLSFPGPLHLHGTVLVNSVPWNIGKDEIYHVENWCRKTFHTIQ